MMASQLLFAVITILISINLPSTLATANLTIIDWTTCEPHDYVICRCANDIMNNVIVRCRFTHLTDLNLIVSNPEDVVRLNISGNHIQEIPSHSFKNYSKLFYLSLSSNNIYTIRQGAFSGLTELRELNLQDNIIKQWDTTLIEQDLPNLIFLNIAQNLHWKPDQRILSLPKLKIILLMLQYYEYSVTNPSFRCYLVQRSKKLHYKNHTFISTLSADILKEVSLELVFSKLETCVLGKVVFRDSSFWVTLKDKGYYFHCEALKTAFLSKDVRRSNISNRDGQLEEFRVKIWSHCWYSIQMLHIITLVIGICTMTFNLIVVITTLRSRVLRESVAHVLVANIAVGDLLISFYTIIVISTRQNMSEEKYYRMYLPYYCRIVGFFFLIGQFSSPMMSFIMTLERYLAVVYCMRPHIRITRLMSHVAMAIVWVMSLSLAVSLMTSPQFSKSTDSLCVPTSNSANKKVLQHIAGVGVILYVIAIALYGHMYVDFQKTNQKTVQIRRENRLAKRIALIMFTNVLFYILPLVAIAIVPGIKGITKEARYIFLKTFGISCLGLNSCLNPVLFSFRNEVFRNEFRKRCLCSGVHSIADHS